MAALVGSCNDVELSAVEAVTVVKALCGSCTYCDVAVAGRFGYRVILSSEYHIFTHTYTCMHKSWLLNTHPHMHTHTHTHTQTHTYTQALFLCSNKEWRGTPWYRLYPCLNFCRHTVEMGDAILY